MRVSRLDLRAAWRMSARCFASAVGNVLTGLTVTAALLSLMACARAEPDYFPGEPGITWVYAVHTENRRETSHHRALVTSLAAEREGGRTVLRRLRHDKSVAFYVRNQRGVFHLDTVRADAADRGLAGIGEPVLKFPLKVGTVWNRTVETGLVPQSGCGICTTTGSIEERGRVRYRVVDTSSVAEVPAGVFENCLKLRGNGRLQANMNSAGMEPVVIHIDVHEWHAPGVGLVKMIWRERPDNPLFSEGRLVMELDAMLKE